MPGQSLSDVARASVEAFNRSDWEQIETLLTPDSVYDEVGTGRRVEGREEIIELLKGWKQTMPDANGTVSSALAGGNEVVLEITWKGTMTGPWGDTPGTGRQQTTRAAWLLSFTGEAISESRQYFDSLAFMQQLGLMPEPAAATV
jgi:steroid delta-isomerase-like uncharacterized protein